MIWLYRLRLLLGLANTFAFTDGDRAARIARLLRIAVATTQQVVASD